MIKKREQALETAAELFLTAFNREIFDHGALERTEGETRLSPQARWFRQTFTDPASFELIAGISSEVSAALPRSLPELLEKAFQTMARALETVVGSKVACGSLKEETTPEGFETIAYALRRESSRVGNVVLAVPESALNFLASVGPNTGARAPSMHLEALMNVDLPVNISFGSTEMPLSEVLKLTTGSIVEFTHRLNEPVNVVVNGCLVARGDVVVVDGNYGVRISEVLASAQPA
jgi:flagellar motor switch protein FliN/FliY